MRIKEVNATHIYIYISVSYADIRCVCREEYGNSYVYVCKRYMLLFLWGP